MAEKQLPRPAPDDATPPRRAAERSAKDRANFAGLVPVFVEADKAEEEETEKEMERSRRKGRKRRRKEGGREEKKEKKHIRIFCEARARNESQED